MVSTNILSDSQESALIDDETYMDIENTFGGSLPIKPEEIQYLEEKPIGRSLSTIMEEKPIQLSQVASTCEEQKRNIKRPREEDYDDEIYYGSTMYNDYFNRPVNFQFYVPENGNSQDWLYSEKLKKLYIKMEKILPLRFTWEPARSGVFLRTELVYLFDEHKSDPVKRCYNHTASTYPANLNMDPDRIKHIVHCVNIMSSYEEKDEHLSVVTPIRPLDDNSPYEGVKVNFKFFCKNSCVSGMNRRATELVFTLEDEGRQILARQTMQIRICSCPKRDKIKEEAESTESSVKRTKPLTNKKMSSCDKHVYKVELNVVGKENYLAVHKYAYDVMAGQAAKTGQHDFFKPYMDEILNKIP